MKVDLCKLKDESQEKLREIMKQLNIDLRELEKEQYMYRTAVTKALKEKDTEVVKNLSRVIADNRRKPNGLRELNQAILKVYQYYSWN